MSRGIFRFLITWTFALQIFYKTTLHQKGIYWYISSVKMVRKQDLSSRARTGTASRYTWSDQNTVGTYVSMFYNPSGVLLGTDGPAPVYQEP
jgi:hypothetical protein